MENSKLLCLFRGQLFDMAAASLNFHFALTRVAKKLSIFKHQNICQLQRTYTSKNHVILAIFFHYFCKTFCLEFNFFPKYCAILLSPSNFPALENHVSSFKDGRQKGCAQCFCFLFTKF